MTVIDDILIHEVAQDASWELQLLYKHLKDLGRSPMITRLQNKALVLPLSKPESSMLNMLVLVRNPHGADATAYVASSFSAGAHQFNLDYLSSIESAQNSVDLRETREAAWPFYGNDPEGDDEWLGENDMLM